MYVCYTIYILRMKHDPLSKLTWNKQLGALWPAIKGSLAKVHKPCIRKDCPACASGAKHPAWLFSYSSAGRRKTMYVPLALVATMRKALENGRKIENLLHRKGPELLKHNRLALKKR